MTLTVEGDRFSAETADGSPLSVLSTDSDSGQTVSYLSSRSGQKALLLQLDWLSRPNGESEDRSGTQGSEPTHVDADGNLVATGGVTPDQTTLPDDVVAEPLAAILSTTTSIHIALGERYGNEARVSRDGVLIGTTNDGAFEDSDLQPGTKYAYTIESLETPPTVDRDTNSRADEYLADSSPVSDPDAMAVTVDAYTLSAQETSARSLDASESPYAARAVPTQTLNTWVHMTYIPQYNVPVTWYQGMACSNAEGFIGDNRGDTAPSNFSFPSHRTAIRVAANWQNPAPYQIYWEKSTGKTRKVVGGKVVETKQASPNGIEVLDTWMTSSVAHFDIRHDVGDPFCIVGSVKYRETVQFWKTGAVAVNGRHNNVPNHESYASYNTDSAGNSAFTKVWRFGTPDFACLVGWMTWCDKSYTASKNF